MTLEDSIRLTGHGPSRQGAWDVARLAAVLLAHVGDDNLHWAALDELRLWFPETHWALLERVGAGAFEATARGEVSETEVQRLGAATFGPQSTGRVVGFTESALNRCESPRVGTWPDSSGAPVVALVAWTPSGALGPSEGDLELLLTLVGRCIVSARRFAELKERVRIDEQTGVLTRSAILELLSREHGRAVRYARSLSVLYVDIDGLKYVNDTYGHGAGDELICRVARALGAALRGSDAVGRLGGDEFLVVLPEADASGASAVMERVHQSLLAQRCVVGGVAIVPHASMGSATLGKVDGEDLVATADARMLGSKRRNQRLRNEVRFSKNDVVAA